MNAADFGKYRLVLFSIYDKKMERFAEPFCAPNEQVARRALVDFLRTPSAQLYLTHPDDFECVEIGTFDTASSALFDVPAYKGACFQFSDLVLETFPREKSSDITKE